MSERVRRAMEYRKKGYNCSQAVIGAFCEELGLEPALAFRLSEGFGAGMGDAGSTCGAVSGAIMAAGMKNSLGPQRPVTKASTYKLAGEIRKQFENMNGSTVCHELKGAGTGNVLRSCDGCIEDAIRITEAILYNDETCQDTEPGKTE